MREQSIEISTRIAARKLLEIGVVDCDRDHRRIRVEALDEVRPRLSNAGHGNQSRAVALAGPALGLAEIIDAGPDELAGNVWIVFACRAIACAPPLIAGVVLGIAWGVEVDLMRSEERRVGSGGAAGMRWEARG